ncbi:MAG: HD domain-containing protein [Desulfobulbaceae bacterium]|jgi:3'-5' exoribonuclease|nr:HD domain-containing protein [Desulfobulbaceae bacterium]
MLKKNTFIADYKIGDEFHDVFVIRSRREGTTKTGKPYLTINIGDKSGELSGNIWDDVEKYRDICQVGAFVKATGKVEEYNGKPQLRLKTLHTVATEEAPLDAFVVVSPRDRAEMAAELRNCISSITKPALKKLLNHFFGERSESGAAFQSATAAKTFHHAYVGGLMEHSLSMAKIADLLVNHYHGLDRDLLVAAALLHDLGKVLELADKGLGVTDYTDAGRLLGHISMTFAMVTEAAARQKDFPPDLLLRLQHCLLSHHSRLEFGSPIVPMTVEAFLLSIIDDLDAKMNMFDRLRREKKEDGFAWSEYQRALERYLYIEKFKPEEAVRLDDKPRGGTKADEADSSMPQPGKLF